MLQDDAIPLPCAATRPMIRSANGRSAVHHPA
jgi:hypothetical protein